MVVCLVGIPPDRSFVDFLDTLADEKLSQKKKKKTEKRNQKLITENSFKIDGEVKKVLVSFSQRYT